MFSVLGYIPSHFKTYVDINSVCFPMTVMTLSSSCFWICKSPPIISFCFVNHPVYLDRENQLIFFFSCIKDLAMVPIAYTHFRQCLNRPSLKCHIHAYSNICLQDTFHVYVYSTGRCFNQKWFKMKLSRWGLRINTMTVAWMLEPDRFVWVVHKLLIFFFCTVWCTKKNIQ